MLAHRDASYALSDHARRSQARRFGPRTAEWWRTGRVYLRRYPSRGAGHPGDLHLHGEARRPLTHHVHAIVSAAFRAARRAKIIKVNVMEEIEAPQKQRAKPRSLTEAQAGKLLASLEGSWMEPVVALAFATGLRRGEALGLRWGDVDLDGARLHVRGQLVQYRDASVAWVPTKTEAGERSISLAADAVNML